MHIHHAYTGLGLTALSAAVIMHPQVGVELLKLEITQVVTLSSTGVVIGLAAFFHDLFLEVKKLLRRGRSDGNMVRG